MSTDTLPVLINDEEMAWIMDVSKRTLWRLLSCGENSAPHLCPSSPECGWRDLEATSKRRNTCRKASGTRLSTSCWNRSGSGLVAGGSHRSGLRTK